VTYILGTFLCVVFYFIGRASKTTEANVADDFFDRRFVDAAYESGRSTQQMFIVEHIGDAYVSPKQNPATKSKVAAAKERLLTLNAKVPKEYLPNRQSVSYLDYIDIEIEK
jgi:hypothetical protein